MALSVCIPIYGVRRETLQATVDSASRQLPDSSELVLLPNGPHACATVDELRLSPDVLVIPSQQSLDLVRNWNRCLTHSRGDLIHMLHADDCVAPGFYDAVMSLRRRFPDAVLYATAAADFKGVPDFHAGAGAARPTLLGRLEAARFLLDDPRHSCGNVVLTRDVVDRYGSFEPEFRYCPDEEAFLRYAAHGATAFDPRQLYLQRMHDDQVRFSTWREPDFVEVYVRSRLCGAEAFGGEIADLTFESTRRRVISIAISLALASDRTGAIHTLDELARHLPGAAGDLRLRAARIAMARPLRPFVLVRRRVLGLRRMRRPQTVT